MYLNCCRLAGRLHNCDAASSLCHCGPQTQETRGSAAEGVSRGFIMCSQLLVATCCINLVISKKVTRLKHNTTIYSELWETVSLKWDPLWIKQVWHYIPVEILGYVRENNDKPIDTRIILRWQYLLLLFIYAHSVFIQDSSTSARQRCSSKKMNEKKGRL